jgi:YidC/Oxa1 family membrane protein insertase
MIFALILKVVLSPLTKKSLTSGRKMQKIQPLMREIQQKYKNDLKTQQIELQKLYKEHDVSPLGGCLPLLLQMPIFFALYPVLHASIEFRQASFVGWLNDLSAPDQYWILPIMMGIFVFIQQKMMQAKQDLSQMDEKQAAMVQSTKMMAYVMPPFLVFIFSGLPSGLVLYWTTFNIFSIIQQYYLNKKSV